MGRYASEADRLRAHRAAFTLALELGCTPKDAEAELRRREGLASIEAMRRQMAAMEAARLPLTAEEVMGEPMADLDPQRWMMRD